VKGFLTIFRRELGAYFNSPIAVIFLAVFVVFTNGLFMMQFFPIGKSDMRPLFGSLPFILNIFLPALSMRLWAEDRRGHTFELLLTFPMRPAALVLGKYFASLAFYALALATTLTVPVMLALIGRSDPGPIATGYLGAFLMGAFFLAIGIFLSGICRDQITAFVLSVIACFTAFFMGTEAFAAFVDGWLGGAGTFLQTRIGLASRLVAFQRGVLDSADLLYFVSGIAALLFLNGASLEGRFRPRARSFLAAASALCLAAFVLFNWIARDLALPRLDLTEGKVYTVSPVSEKILKSLKAPVTAKLYLSPPDKMPTALKTLEREIVDKLEELRLVSGGKLRYKTIHLESAPDGNEAESSKLKDSGVVPFQVESVQRDEVGVKLIYSTLVLEYKEKPGEIIPRLVPQTLYDLEYQLLSRIQKMTLNEKPEIAIFAPVKEEGLPAELEQAAGQKRAVIDEFQTATLLIRNNGYRATRIALTKENPIPERASMLLALNPGALSDRQRWEINRYLRRGGTVVVGAEGYEFTYKREERGVEGVPSKKPLDVNRLLEAFGVKIADDLLMDESAQVVSLTTGQQIGPFAVEMPVMLPNQIVVREDQMNRTVALTERLPAIFFLWGSALELAKETGAAAGLRSTVLFTSSAKSWRMPFTGENLTADNTKAPASLEGKYPLALMLEGTFPDASGGQPAPKWSAADTETGPKMEEGKPGRLLVIGSSKAFSDELVQNAGNLNLFANVVDGLTLGPELVQIRSKISPVRDIRKLSAAERLWYKFFTTALVPVLILLAAAIRSFVRRKEKEMYLASRAAR